ncbi:hypothetical protein GSF22_20030 [Micromonospora echinofusca]|uniref:Uncharacterized protein n=2 Tax=Micromonospora echinofusca TaxID=47858 RepID=A0ABS3VV62_MICEH|nr:hypothetical protein [Micromonospora echinofusca]
MRAALEALAKVDEVWLAGVMPPEWADRALCGGDLRRALPTAALLGATAVVGADAVAQMLTVLVQSGSTG